MADSILSDSAPTTKTITNNKMSNDTSDISRWQEEDSKDSKANDHSATFEIPMISMTSNTYPTWQKTMGALGQRIKDTEAAIKESEEKIETSKKLLQTLEDNLILMSEKTDAICDVLPLDKEELKKDSSCEDVKSSSCSEDTDKGHSDVYEYLKMIELINDLKSSILEKAREYDEEDMKRQNEVKRCA